MKRDIAIKKVHFVPKSIVNYFYASSASDRSFHISTQVVEQMAAIGDLGSLSSDELQDEEEKTEEMEPGDLLFALAGSVKFDPADKDKCYHPSIREALKSEIRVKDPESVKEAQKTEGLLALAGTLECDVTDIGERHDDYIGAALLEKLWGDADE